MKCQVIKYAKFLANDKFNTAALIYCRLMSAVYEKQLVGMGELNNETISYEKNIKKI